jgi:MoxR-like ATPase
MAKQNASTFAHSLKPSQLMTAMRIVHTAKKSLMVWGAPGIGKSQIAKQYADTFYPTKAANAGYIEQLNLEISNGFTESASTLRDLESRLVDQDSNLVDMRLSQVEPTDLRGIPVPITYFTNLAGEIHLKPSDEEIKTNGLFMRTQTVWASPKILDLPDDWQGIIFMDEVNSAMPVVQAAAYQLFLDHKIGELVLPHNAFMMAAGNRECDGGVTFELATPLKDRMVHVELKADLKEWTEKFALRNRVHTDVVSFLQTRGDDFNTLSPNNKNACGGSSPRSWVAVSDLLKASSKLGTLQEEDFIMNVLVEGTVGDDVALRFKTHRNMTSKLPPAIDILTGKFTDVNKIENIDTSKNYAICTNLTYFLAERSDEMKKGTFPELTFNAYLNQFLVFIDGNYGSRQPEMAIMSLRVLLDEKIYPNPTKVPFYTDFAKKHKKLIMDSRAIS